MTRFFQRKSCGCSLLKEGDKEILNLCERHAEKMVEERFKLVKTFAGLAIFQEILKKIDLDKVRATEDPKHEG